LSDIFRFFRYLFRARNAKESWDKDEGAAKKNPGFDMNERYRQLGTFRVRRRLRKRCQATALHDAGAQVNIPVGEGHAAMGSATIGEGEANAGSQRVAKDCPIMSTFSDIYFLGLKGAIFGLGWRAEWPMG